MDEIDITGLNHLREDIEKVHLETGIDAQTIIKLCQKPLSADEIAKRVQSMFEKLGEAGKKAAIAGSKLGVDFKNEKTKLS